ncbi:MAG: AMIN domain-containing protein, partial [Coleofasciculus sp. S288]|nr:AMIN domain-containing protein [Coleofasciculus sp. S288]
MRFRWLLLLPSFLSVFLFSAAVQASELVFWRFDRNQNRLEFNTDAGVQPRAQLITDPTRVVIDLPGITLGRPTANQQVGGAIREIRVGQFENRTTRIVIELAPGYTLDPEKVKFRGISPTQWTVDLPTPERVQSRPSPPPSERSQRGGDNPPPRSQPPQQPPSRGSTSRVQLESFQVTRDGFFIRTRGGEPGNIRVNRSRDRRRVEIELEGATLSRSLADRDFRVNRSGVSQVQFSQEGTSPPVAKITLSVTRDSPDWQASFNGVGLGGIVVLPQGTPDNSDRRAENPSGGSTRPISTATQLATIESVELANNGTQLLIRANQAVRATSTWDRSANAYRITISGAQLPERFRGPQLDANSPLSRVQVRQQDARTVVILVQPGTGVQLGELNQLNDQLLALQLQRSQPVAPPISSIPVPPPERTNPPAQLPRVPDGRIVVMIDPGHGGKDPGTI